MYNSQHNNQVNQMVDEDPLVLMGKIIHPFGIQGFVKIKLDGNDPDLFQSYKELYLFMNDSWVSKKIERSSKHGSILNVKFVGINDRDQAISLKGVTVALRRSAFPIPNKDEYYWSDLIGLGVVNLQGEDFGQVYNLLETGANSVLAIRNAKNNNEYLIPFVGIYIIEVDLKKRCIVVDWGLDY